MAREGADTDFEVNVGGIGSFCFAKRTMRDEIKIQVEYARMIEGVEPTTWLGLLAGWLSALKVLTVRAPDGWDIDAMDPLATVTYGNLQKVHKALTEKESSFRSGKKQAIETPGKEPVTDGGVLVPAQVPAAEQ